LKLTLQGQKIVISGASVSDAVFEKILTALKSS